MRVQAIEVDLSICLNVHMALQGRKDDVYVCSEVAFKCICWVNDFEKDLIVFRRNVGPFRLN